MPFTESELEEELHLISSGNKPTKQLKNTLK